MSASKTDPQSASPFPHTAVVQPALDIPDGFRAFPQATHRASTVLFNNLRELRAYGRPESPYWRYGLHGTPTSEALCQQLAQIEGGRHALLLPSGLAAISLVYFSCLKAGDDVLVPDNAYDPTCEHGAWLARDFGITMRRYDPMIGAGIAELIRPETRLIWLEAPGSVTMEVPDAPAIVAAARARNVRTAIDNTWAAGLMFKPFAHGVDISVQALTKYQSGGSDVLMGAVIVNDDHLEKTLQHTRMRMGWGVSSDDCYLVLRGLQSMPVRLAAHDRNARELAEWLVQRPEVARVLHPALPDCPGHEYWKRDFTGATGLFSVLFQPQCTQAQIDAFVEGLRYFAIGYSWGGAHSLALPYDVPAMRSVSPWPPAGKPAGGLVRFYVGLEDPRDLIADVKQSLEAHLR